MAISGQSVVPAANNTSVSPQEVAALKDIQVNFLKSPELRSDFATGALNTVSAEGKASSSKTKEEQARQDFLRTANHVASPKQEKPFTALPVIVSTKTRNTNEVSQTNEKVIQREFPNARGGCPDILGNMNPSFLHAELREPFVGHRPSMTQTTLDARKGLEDDTLKPSVSSLTINSELQLELEAYQNQLYSRLPNGDYVIYDSSCKMMTFKHRSKTSLEMMTYQNLDFQEFKRQMDA